MPSTKGPMNGIIIYQSKYGATQQYAEWLGTALRLPIISAEKLNAAELLQYDLILTGSPVYYGKLLIRDWITENQLLLSQANLFFFIVSIIQKDDTTQLAKVIEENIPLSLRESSKFFFLAGRVDPNQLSWMEKLMLKNKVGREGIDGVTPENMEELIAAMPHAPEPRP